MILGGDASAVALFFHLGLVTRERIDVALLFPEKKNFSVVVVVAGLDGDGGGDAAACAGPREAVARVRLAVAVGGARGEGRRPRPAQEEDARRQAGRKAPGVQVSERDGRG